MTRYETIRMAEADHERRWLDQPSRLTARRSRCSSQTLTPPGTPRATWRGDGGSESVWEAASLVREICETVEARPGGHLDECLYYALLALGDEP